MSSRISFFAFGAGGFPCLCGPLVKCFLRPAGVYTEVSPSVGRLVSYPMSLLPRNHVQEPSGRFSGGPGLSLWWDTGALTHEPGLVEHRKRFPR